MLCVPFSDRRTGCDILEAANEYSTAEDISRANCVGIRTDGAAALTEHKKDFQAEVQQTGLHVNFIHCTVHSEVLASSNPEPKTALCGTRGGEKS
jgi:hypothetical protein